MVMCNMESVPRPPALPGDLLGPASSHKPPPLPPPLRLADHKNESRLPRSSSCRSKSSNNSHGFRLMDNHDETGSVYSVYKQKIDAMFESDSSSNTKNIVQARIEKMFTDIAKDTGIPITKMGIHSFSVDYLGSVPLLEKVTSLAGLQTPLRELYFAYKRDMKQQKGVLTGRLEISSQGLKVQYQGEKGDLEQMNSFPTIAVWSAVKFVIHDNPQKSCAFLPLITDPDNIDKQNLFRPLDSNEKKYISLETHSPLFAVVMRKMGVHKQLECHGFVCQTSEDAIVIAATLYKSLMSHMKAKEMKPKNRNGVTCMSLASSNYNDVTNSHVPVRPPRKKRSSASSVVSEADTQDVSDTQPLLSSDKKPLKKSSKTRRAPKAPPPPPKPSVDLDAILPYEEPIKSDDTDGRNNGRNDNNNNNINEITRIADDNSNNEKGDIEEVREIKPKKFSDKINTYMSKEQKQLTAEIKQVMSEGSNRGLKRVQSLRKRKEESEVKNENTGDILTKVTIPRSGSFLNTAGLTRYKSKICRKNGQATGGSPLGFSELFNEFRLQEGLHSLDEILGVIIDPEGMSFNDLKPIYKEFLLKLAVTLTKDELYQRSKAIMRRQKKKMLRRNHNMPLRRSHHISIGSKFKRLKHIFQKSFRIKLDKSKKRSSISTNNKDKVITRDSKLPESSISTSSYDTRHFIPKDPQGLKKQSNRKKSAEFQSMSRRDRFSTSEESDFFSVRRNRGKLQPNLLNQNRNSSSGYVSCSECSYDSESCTCVSADKCYCSLGNKNIPKKHYRRIDHNQNKTEDRCHCSYENTLTFCGCDTDSCTESNKCYCQASANRVILDQLKQRGLFLTEPAEMIAARHKKLCKRNSHTKSTRSLEYMPNPSEGYYEKLKSKSKSTTSKGKHLPHDNWRHKMGSSSVVDYELFSITDGDLTRNIDRCMYTRALHEARQYGIHRQSSLKSHGSSKYGSKNKKTIQSTTMSPEARNEALSVKKSAEIAALFADIKLSQTTDITHLAPREYRDIDMVMSSKNYHKLHQSISYSKPNKCPNRDIKAVNSLSQKTAQNIIYASSGKSERRNSMYSTRNGLYTIQSQSDDSRKSSLSEGCKSDKEYQNNSQFGQHNRNLSNNLENSLGYLP